MVLETLTHIPEKRTKKRELTKNWEKLWIQNTKIQKITITDTINNNKIILLLFCKPQLVSKIKSSLLVLKQQEIIIIIEQILLPELDISPLKYFLIPPL